LREPFSLAIASSVAMWDGQQLATQLQADWPLQAKKYDFILEMTERGLVLKNMNEPRQRPIHIDWAGKKRAVGRGKQELIAKAIGVAILDNPTVLDLTAGLGRDSVFLVRLGCSVLALERSPVIFALLQDAVARVQADPDCEEWIDRLKILNQDGFDYLREINEQHLPDVIYMDPMYPLRKKSALGCKEMRTFRLLVGADEDSADLLRLALTKVRKRVVVKRPLKEPPLIAKPNSQFKGNTVRYDLYLASALNKSKEKL
jgi:16S rRNA (guanine1516-N2)-methyltransferase